MNYYNRSVLFLLALFVNQSICQESTSCQIMSFSKHSDSSCKIGLDKTAEEKEGYIPQLNNLIESGTCDHIDPIQNDQIKLKVDCLSNSSIKFGFYDNSGDDATCGQEKKTVIAEDGACARMSEGIYYKFNIVPSATSRRQMQFVVAVPVQGQPTNYFPQRQFYPQQQLAYLQQFNQQQFIVPQQRQQYYPTTQARNYAAQISQDQPQSPFARSAGQTVGQFVANQVDTGIQGIQQGINNIFDPSFQQFQQPSLLPPILFTRPNLLNQQQVNADMDSMNKSSSLSTGAIIGIIGGGVCLVFLCIASICYFLRGNKHDNARRDMEMNSMGGRGNMQQGPNFETGDVTDPEIEPRHDQTETHGHTNQKEGDAMYGSHLQSH